MSEPIFIKNLKGLEKIIAKKCDKDGNGKLEKTDSFDEISLFDSMKNKLIKGKENSSIFNNQYIAERDATYVAPKFMPMPVPVKEVQKKANNDILKISSLIEAEIKKKGGDISEIDVLYWADRINRVSKKYNFPSELLTAIIAKESTFKKNIDSASGKGPMGVTGIACRAFFPGAKGSWHDIYKQMNEPLLNDILYKKDDNGNFVKDAKGNYVLKYNSAEELRDACAKDDELGMMVGLLSFEMNYVCAVANKYYAGKTWQTAPKAIEALKNDSLDINEIDNRNLIKTALKNYNSVFSSYAPTIIDTLQRHGIKFEELDIIGKVRV